MTHLCDVLQEKKFLNRLPTELKSTFLSRLRSRSAPLRMVEESISETDESIRDNNTWATVVTKGRTGVTWHHTVYCNVLNIVVLMYTTTFYNDIHQVVVKKGKV